jgi:hypothetical protein
VLIARTNISKELLPMTDDAEKTTTHISIEEEVVR